MVAGRCNVDVERSVHVHRVRVGKSRTRGRSPVASETGGTGSCYRGNLAICGDFTDAATGRFRNIDVERRVHGDSGRGIYRRARGRGPVARGAGGAGAGKDVDDPGSGGDFTDFVVGILCNIDVARTVGGHAVRIIQARARGGGAVARVTS